MWALSDFGDCPAGEVAEHALMEIYDEPEKALVGCGCLCEEAMKMILNSTDALIDEVGMFRALQRWVAADEDERGDTGHQLASCLSFKDMPPSFLLGTVAESGWLEKDAMFAIFQDLALKAEGDHGFDSTLRDGTVCPTLYHGRKELPYWERSASVKYSGQSRSNGGHDIGLLDKTLETGSWTWEILVEEIGTEIAVGVVTGDIRFDKFLGRQLFGYAHKSNGYCYHGQSQHLENDVGPTFDDGDTVRVSLDCDRGTVDVAVNDGPPFRTFEDMVDFDTFGPEHRSFVPAVSVRASDRVRLVKFRRLDDHSLFQ